MGFAKKITSGIITVLIIVSVLIGVFSYQTAYRQVEESVGIETVGCANITTGLVDPAAIASLGQGDLSELSTVEEQLNWTVDHKSLFKESFIMSLDGTILAADKNLKARGYEAGDTFYFNEADREAIQSTKHSVYTKIYSFDGVELLSGYGPIYKDHDHTKEIVGLMVINFDASIIQERTWEIISLPFAIGGGVFLLAIIAAYIFIHRMVRPLEKLSRSVNRVAEGDLSLNEAPLTSKDEIGTLSRDFFNMTTNLRGLITEVNETSLQVSASSEQLSASAEETGQAGEQTVRIIQSLADGAETQLESLESSSSALQGMSSFIEQIVDKVDSVTNEANVSAQASKEGAASMQLGVTQMDKISNKITALSSSIDTLSGHSKEIQSIVDVITGIAAETNLLALNAAIEAARAGEEGKGFAVVANSVRKLAERSASSSQQVSQLINLIMQLMEATIVTMSEATEEVKLGTDLVDEAGSSFEVIYQSNESSAASVEEVRRTVHQLSENAQLLVHSMQQLVHFANATVDGTQTISAAAQEQLASMQEVDTSANFLSSLSEKLHTLIERFKLS